MFFGGGVPIGAIGAAGAPAANSMTPAPAPGWTRSRIACSSDCATVLATIA
jgi:hypothetical protein